MSQFALSNFLTCFTTLFLAIFVFFANKKSKVNQIFCIYSLSISEWSFTTALHAFTTSETISFLSARIMNLGVPFIPVLFFHFCLEILESYDTNKNKLFTGYFISFVFIIVNFTTDLIIPRVRPKLGYHYFMDSGFLYPLLILFFSFYAFTGLYLLGKACRIYRGNKGNQLKYLFSGSLLGYIFGASCFFPVYNITLFPYPFGSYAISVYVLLTTYAILRYRLMDIKVAITRTGIFIAVYTLVLGLPFAVGGLFKGRLIEILGPQWWTLPLGLMAVLATVGPFIYIYVEHKAEDRLLKEQRRYQETLKQASVGMTRIRNLRKLLDLIAHIVTKTVHISYAGIYLYNRETDEYLLQVSRDKGRMPIPKITSDNPLITWLAQTHEPLIYDEVKMQMQNIPDATYQNLEENMRLLTASVIIPSFLEDKLIGFFVLGDKLSGQIYTPEDLNVFQVLASQAALAIENAQFYEETKEMQEQVAQAEKMATVGTMADGLSHQINNRFYALSLIAGDTIDTIKMTDTSKCTPEIKEMLNQINYALGRIQTNVMQGGEVVRGILKYTRKGDEGLEDIALDQILDGTLDMVQYKVKLSEIDLVRDYPKDTPKIRGNLVQLQEAFFNFIDNAYDSIVERRSLLKEPGYKGRITVSAIPKDNHLEIAIEDNGMGIKDDNAKKVFTPFFTTKISSRRGTGLGLYVIRRIITDTHKGKISFESAHRVGTRFIIELPVAT